MTEKVKRDNEIYDPFTHQKEEKQPKSKEKVFEELRNDYRGIGYNLDGINMVYDEIFETSGRRKQITRYELGTYEDQPVIVFDSRHPEQMFRAYNLYVKLREMGVETITIAPLNENQIWEISRRSNTLANIAELVESQVKKLKEESK